MDSRSYPGMLDRKNRKMVFVDGLARWHIRGMVLRCLSLARLEFVLLLAKTIGVDRGFR